MEPVFLGLDDALAIHRDQLARYGGAPGIRDMALLQGAVAAAKSGTREGYLHSDLFEMASACLFHIVKDHPFVDGNKRVGLVASLVFLELNGIRMHAASDDVHDLVVGVAAGTAARIAVSAFLRRNAGR